MSSNDSTPVEDPVTPPQTDGIGSMGRAVGGMMTPPMRREETLDGSMERHIERTDYPHGEINHDGNDNDDDDDQTQPRYREGPVDVVDTDDVDDDADDDDDDDDIDEEEEEDEEEDDATQVGAARSGGARNIIRAEPTLDSLYGLRDLGREAVCWTLSSAKPGNGVDQILDGASLDTYWQSDGSQPHYVQLYFSRRVPISHVCLHLDYNLDESYTPKKVCVQTGMTVQDLTTATVVEFVDPVGWCIIPIQAPPDPLDDEDDDDEDENNPHRHKEPMPIRTHMVQISILSMHQNGRDTHVRQVKLFGPNREALAERQSVRDTVESVHNLIPSFRTVGLSQFSMIR